MKSIIKGWGLITLASILPLVAQTTKTKETTETTHSADGAVTETTTVKTFNPEVRTKVVTYFDHYKGNPHGLPSGFVGKVHVKEIPAAWRTTRIAPGVIVTEAQRPYLLEPPAELVKVLPSPSAGIRYYVAGSNVVAVDTSYRIVDSVQIPTIKYTEDEDEVKIESKEGKKTTKIEVDKDDGEVEVDEDD